MSHAINYNPESQTVELMAQGNFTLLDVKGIVSELLQVAKVNNCHLILNDSRKAKLDLSTMEIYGLPKMIADLAAAAGLDIHDFQRAAVVVSDYDNYKFFETVTYNQSQNMKVFQDIDIARKWLSEK
jgi:hypothetical protein